MELNSLLSTRLLLLKFFGFDLLLFYLKLVGCLSDEVSILSEPMEPIESYLDLMSPSELKLLLECLDILALIMFRFISRFRPRYEPYLS